MENLLAKKLRIGNFITVHNCLQEVVELPLPENCTEENTKGINVTEEWLLNLGFNKDYKKGYIGIDVGNTDFVLTCPKIMGDFQEYFAFQFHSGGWSKFKEVKYIHELQNLFFAITGQELELKDVQ